MKSLKQEVTNLFSDIQYDSEVLMTSMDVLGHSEQAKEIRKVYSHYILNKLRMTKDSLLASKSEDELIESLSMVKTDYHSLFETMNKQINRLKDSEDISDYIFQLKQESKDLAPGIVDRVKNLISRKG